MTATAQDEKIAALIARYGHAGYGLWWLVVEAVAARLEGDSEPSVTYHVTKWSHLLSLRGSHVRQALLKLQLTHLVTVEWSGSDIKVTIPNLLKYRDEYSKKSGHTPESVRSKKQIQNTDTDTDTDTPTPCAAVAAPASDASLFAVPAEPKIHEAWLKEQHDSWYHEAYWNHNGRDASRRAFSKRVRLLVRGSGMTADAAVGFLREQATADRDRFFPTADWEWRQNLHPSTWLNGERWEDRPKAREQPAARGKVRNCITVEAIPPPTPERELEAMRELLASPDEPEDAKAVWRKRISEMERPCVRTS